MQQQHMEVQLEQTIQVLMERQEMLFILSQPTQRLYKTQSFSNKRELNKLFLTQLLYLKFKELKLIYQLQLRQLLSSIMKLLNNIKDLLIKKDLKMREYKLENREAFNNSQ